MKETLKKEGKFKYVIAVLIVILITLISYIGIYVSKNGNYQNIIENYKLSMELEGNRTIILKPDDSKETITKDAEGNTVENPTEEQTQENGYTKEEVPVNSKENLTQENFEKVKEIVKNRLDEYNFEGYFIRQDLDTGNIILELAENDSTDDILSVLNQQGKFEIKDSTSKEVLMDNKMIKKAQVLYNTTTSGTSVYLNIEFTKEGKQKLEQITNDYKKQEEKEQSSQEDQNNETQQNSENTEENKEQKEIVMQIDGQSIITTSFEEPITNGQIQLTVGQASKDTDTLQGYINQARSTATVLTTGNMPVKYTQDTNKYIKANIPSDIIKIACIIALIAVLLVTIYLIVKYKLKGLIGSILAIGYMGVVLLVVRYTNVDISISGIASIIIIAIINYILQVAIIENSNKTGEKADKLLNVFGKYILAVVPVFIISIVFSFQASVLLNSFGMILFWGIILTIIYNLIFGKVLFDKRA